MNKDLVTVVVPNFNHRSYIKECLVSVYHQSYRPIELIVIDDGSYDDSQKLIKSQLNEFSGDSSFKTKFIRQKNLGVSAAINKGIHLARGKFIALLNSDDYYEKDRIRQMIKPLQRQETEICFSLVKFVDADSKRIPANDSRTSWYLPQVSTRFKYPSVSYSLLTSPLHVTSGNYIFTRRLAKKIGGFRNYQWCSDYDFIMRASVYTEPILYSRQLLNYRLHETNTIHSKDLETQKYHSEIRRIQEDFFESGILGYLSKKDQNMFAPFPFNWPKEFKKFYCNARPFYGSEPFVSQNSLAFESLFTKNFDLEMIQNLFGGSQIEKINIFRALPGYHYLHSANFFHSEDLRIKTIQIDRISKILAGTNSFCYSIYAKARIKFPYINRIAFLGVFRNSRLVAVLRYSRTQNGSDIFFGISDVDSENVSIKHLKICWIDFQGTTLECRWKKIPNFTNNQILRDRLTILRKGGIDSLKTLDHTLIVQGWASLGMNLPEKYELSLNGVKQNILPILYSRPELGCHFADSNSLTSAGFRYSIPLTKSLKKIPIHVCIRLNSGKQNFKLQKVWNPDEKF